MAISAKCAAWWPNRRETERAWKVPAAEILATNCNLDRKNPNAAAGLEHLPPEQLIDSILEKERRIIELLGEIKALLAEPGP